MDRLELVWNEELIGISWNKLRRIRPVGFIGFDDDILIRTGYEYLGQIDDSIRNISFGNQSRKID